MADFLDTFSKITVTVADRGHKTLSIYDAKDTFMHPQHPLYWEGAVELNVAPYEPGDDAKTFKAIDLEVRPGQTISDAALAAKVLSEHFNIPVTFEHNKGIHLIVRSDNSLREIQDTYNANFNQRSLNDGPVRVDVSLYARGKFPQAAVSQL